MKNNKYNKLNKTVCYEADMTYIQYSSNTRKKDAHSTHEYHIIFSKKVHSSLAQNLVPPITYFLLIYTE